MTKTATMSAVATLFATMAGRHALTTAEDGTVTKYEFAELSAKLGKLKDKSEAEYVVLRNVADASITITLHPQHALRLMSKGEDSGMTLEPIAEAASDETAPEAGAAEAGAEAGAEAAPEAEPKAPSKKEQFIAIFLSTANGVKDAGGDPKTVRQLVKTNVAHLEISDACFNTYFQNVKSGKWAV